jgi:uncharacterized membrane protein YbhN (UPF0104 family)
VSGTSTVVESTTHEPAAAPPGRHPRDLATACLAAGLVALCTFAARGLPASPMEVATFEQVQQIPSITTPVWQAFAVAGGWVGVAVATGATLYLKRIRLGLQIVAAGVLAWLGAVGIQALVGSRPVPLELFEDDVPRLQGLGGFAVPAAHVAVVAAMVVVAAPYLKRRYCRIAWAVLVLVALADLYLGAQLPLDALAGVALGWCIGAAFHVACGAPGRQTSAAEAWRALERAGLLVEDVVPVKGRWWGPLEFTATTLDGQTLRVEAVRRLHRRAGPWYRLRRLLASLDVEDEPPLSSIYHETDHEGLVTLFAQRAGVRVPPMLLTCEARHSVPLLVRRQIDGRRLSGMATGEIVDDRLLDAIWAQVDKLGAARIAHHDLRARNILVDRDGDPWLLNLTLAKVGASMSRTAQDVAEALVGLTAIVGVERAVQSACRILGPDRLEPALAYLQPLALPRRIRKQLKQERYELTDLRETLADRIDRPIPTLRSPLRPATVVSLLLLAAAVYTLLPQLTSMHEVLASMADAHWGWLGLATLTGFVAIVLSAVSIMGSTPTALPFWPTTAVQVAAAFTGRTTPGGVGFFAVNIAFMERRGFRRSSALGVTMLNMAATSIVGGLWCVIALLGIGAASPLEGFGIPRGWPLLAGAVTLVIAAALLATPFGRRRFVRPAWPTVRELLATLRKPVRALQLFGGVTGHLIVSGLGLSACLAAFHAQAPLLAVLAVFMVGQTLGHVVPIPGGIGPTEALMVGGLTALGVAPTVAVAAVLAARLLTYWLPVLPGIAAFRYLQHRRVV